MKLWKRQNCWDRNQISGFLGLGDLSGVTDIDVLRVDCGGVTRQDTRISISQTSNKKKVTLCEFT